MRKVMLALLVILPIAAIQGQDIASPNDLRVQGTVEMSESAADAAALVSLDGMVRQRVEPRARRAALEVAPAWLPDVVVDAIVRDWVADVRADGLIKDQRREVACHDHDSLGISYRTQLSAVLDEATVERRVARVRQLVRSRGKTLLTRSFVVLGSWVALAAMVSWLDRQSRGYMRARLRWLGLVAGVLTACAVLSLG